MCSMTFNMDQLIAFPKEENLGNKRKPMHQQVYLPSVPTFGLSTLFSGIDTAKMKSITYECVRAL